MAAVEVFVLTMLACLLYSVRRRHWPRPAVGIGADRSGTAQGGAAEGVAGKFGRPWSGRGRGQDISMPRLVRQLSALLASGRSGPVLWAALADVLAAEQSCPGARGGGPGHPAGRGPARTPGHGARLGLQCAGQPALALLRAVERASALGLPTGDAVRSAVRQGARMGPGTIFPRKSAGLSPGQWSCWLEVAACFEVCEASGAPVAAVLSRLADSLEVEQDTAQLRETALAGPRATVRLLTWLPFIGLGLGTGIGVDPLAVLLGSRLGWACLGVGMALVLFGRWWSYALISAAARTPSQKARPVMAAAGLLKFRRAAAGEAGPGAGHIPVGGH